jgi:hypothetical protein
VSQPQPPRVERRRGDSDLLRELDHAQFALRLLLEQRSVVLRMT